MPDVVAVERDGAPLHAAGARRHPARDLLVQPGTTDGGNAAGIWRGWPSTRACRATISRSPGSRCSTTCPPCRASVARRSTLEGWALYAEQLAEEMGLYIDTESLLGMLATSLMRAARLVVDTGLHALGWSRRAGSRVHGRPRADARSVPGQRDRSLHRDAGAGSVLSDRKAGDPAPAGRRKPATRPAIHAPRRSMPSSSTAGRCRCRCSRRRSAAGRAPASRPRNEPALGVQ